MGHRRIPMIFAMAALAIATGALAADGWTTYRNADFRFSIEVPYPPEITATESVEGGPPGVKAIVGAGDGGALVFEAADVSKLLASGKVDKEHILDVAMSAALKGPTLTEDTGAVIAIRGTPGREFTAHNADVVVRERILLKNGRLYSATGIGRTAKGVPAQYPRFVQSLTPD